MSAQEPKSHELVGRTIAGKFELLEHTGAGSMGDVFRAKHLALDSTVALKIMRRELAQDPMFFERFQREAKAASRLEHPNSIRVVDFGKDDGDIVYMAMEFLDGRDLFKVLAEDGQLSEERIVGMLLQVLGALSPAHALGIIHRDLKPENIMVLATTDDEGARHDFIKVCDFGIAKLTDSRSLTLSGRDGHSPTPSPSVTGFLGPSLTSTGQLVGTPEYMSPEQARGDSLDTRTDLYSVGVILYQLLTGQVPFNGESAIGIALKHVTDAPVPPSQIRSGISPELERICLKALQKARESRYQTAREMRGDLRMFSVQSFYELPDGYDFSPRPPRIERISRPTPQPAMAVAIPRSISSSGNVQSQITAPFGHDVPKDLPSNNAMSRPTRKLSPQESQEHVRESQRNLMDSVDDESSDEPPFAGSNRHVLRPDPSEPVVLSPSAAPPPDQAPRRTITIAAQSSRGMRALVAVGLGGAAVAGILWMTQNASSPTRAPWLAAEQMQPKGDEHLDVQKNVSPVITTAPTTPKLTANVPTLPRATPKHPMPQTNVEPPQLPSPQPGDTRPPPQRDPKLPAPGTSASAPGTTLPGTLSTAEPAAPQPTITPPKSDALDRPVPKFDRAAVSLGAMHVQHGSKEAMTARVKQQMPLLSACYRTALAKKGSKVDGTATMSFSTDEHARIVRATVTGLPELPEAARCMESALVGQIVQPEAQNASTKADATLSLKSE